MPKSFLERIKDAGIVGAGGAGFPTHVKVNNTAEIVIANGAECEPLLRVDQQIMEFYPEKVIDGLRSVMKITSAKRGVIALKEKYHNAVDNLKAALGNKTDISIFIIGNYYPAGDEQQVIYEVTGKVVPVGALPIDVGVIVCNVNTLYNVSEAINGKSVTNKFVTVTGEVKNPVTLNVPVGISISELIAYAGGPTDRENYAVIIGGPAMGKYQADWDAPVTKTTGGVLVLPKDHMLIKKRTDSIEEDFKLARAACCQCTFCTQLCPRAALGLGTEPNKVMRSFAYGDNMISNVDSVVSCCDCGICTYYACSMGLSPSKMVTRMKGELGKAGLRPSKTIPQEVDSERENKKIPVKRFIQRLDVSQYDVPAPMLPAEFETSKVRILLKQHIGAPATPVVAKGDAVEKGDLIGAIEEGKLGANVHASITGVVSDISDCYIEISRR